MFFFYDIFCEVVINLLTCKILSKALKWKNLIMENKNNPVGSWFHSKMMGSSQWSSWLVCWGASHLEWGTETHTQTHTHTRAHIPTTEIHFTIKMEKKLFLIFQTWVWGFRFLLAISVLSDVEISCGDIHAVWSCASAAWDALSPHPDDSLHGHIHWYEHINTCNLRYTLHLNPLVKLQLFSLADWQMLTHTHKLTHTRAYLC